MRSVIFHHHLFKNAGTSVDVALRRCFGPRWRNVEGEGRELTAADLAALLAGEPELRALSSHTFRPPFDVPGVRLLPIVLLRHPLDRVRSAYEFERNQVADTQGTRLAKANDFAGYVRARLAQPHDRSIRNFQTNKLSHLPRNAAPDTAEELLSALDCIRRLPFIGLVETYDFSMQVFSGKLAEQLGGQSLEVVRANTTRKADDQLATRIAAAEAALGPDLAAAFHAANRQDQHLFELVAWMHRQLDGSLQPR
jgi:hypothetical protein